MTRIGTGAVGIGLCLVVIAGGLGSAAGTGVRGRVGDVVLRVAPAVTEGGSPLRPGDDAVVRFRVFAQHGADDELVSVGSDEARQVELRWDRDCDGAAEPVATLPLEDGVVPGGGAGTDYRVVLVDLGEGVTVGSTVTVEFGFARSGELRVTVPVTSAVVGPSRCAGA
ncbi:hypothetical protein Q5530_27190 [Saccharothrix sp. BKS2]|uniref:hypothetical protein n=1 Tax=Saccharothrix sp. BKS2 TaxID=3064400 RepID=UPI0039EBB0D6